MNNIKRLPDSEFEIMNILWDLDDPIDRRQIEEKLFVKHQIAMTTLLTLLTRLSEKGFIRIEKEGRRSRYYKLIGKKDYLSSQSNSFFKQLCNGDMKVFANALCDSDLSKEDLAELRKLLEEKK
ncbi:MAG: BlaI/MecI/CopY family transcriptional regulator [Erysipelotrichaceae bacterium]|nr:BlaI/MecI/CopY family transcriptional regulator [Erysipelotrichaceae bacterium]